MIGLDPDWTPEVAYGILRDALNRFVGGEGSALSLQQWLLAEFATPPDTSRRHPVQNLYRLAVTDLTVYLQCDFERADIEESLREGMAIVDSGKAMGFTKMTRSPCFFKMMRTQQIPEPLVNVTPENTRRGWERLGFREI